MHLLQLWKLKTLFSFQKTYSSLWPPIYFSYAPFQLIRRA
jgi:hypothetical protein